MQYYFEKSHVYMSGLFRHKPSTFLSFHLCIRASMPPLEPPVIVPDFVNRIPSMVTTMSKKTEEQFE